MSTLNNVQQNFLRSKLLLKDVDFEMKKEFDRRKKLRLQQVREQAKDLAYSLREKVRLEKSHQKNLCKNKMQKQLNQWQEHKLNELQELYKNCLENVGLGHVKAVDQPDLESIHLAEQRKNAEQAAKRGKEARRQKKMLDEENRYRVEAPLIKKQLARTKEDIRSVLVSSLSPPPNTLCSTLSSDVQEKQNKITRTTEQLPKVRVLQEIPSNIELETARLEIKQDNKKPIETEIKSKQEENHFKNSTKNSTSKCTECGYTCCCHGGSINRTLRRRCFSESRLASESESEYDSDSTWPPRASPRSQQQSDYSRKAINTVKCYDYSNNFRKKYRKPVFITKHSQAEPDLKSSQEVQSEIDLIEKKTESLKEMSNKSRLRGKLALYKERINRDFEDLRRELEVMAKQERVLTSKTRPSTLRGLDRKRREDLRQRRIEGALLNSQNVITIEKTKSTVNIETETPNTLNVSRVQHSREPSPTQPPKPPLETDLQKVLNRIEERRKILLQKLESEEISVHLPRERSSSRMHSPVGEEPFMYSNKKDNVDVYVKSPPELIPKVDVEVQKSSAQVDKIYRFDSGEALTVTVRVKTNPAQPKTSEQHQKRRYHKTKLSSGYKSSSTSYYSPPDKLTPSERVAVDTLVKELHVKGRNRDYLTPYITKLLSMSRESIEEVSETLKEHSPEPGTSGQVMIIPKPVVQVTEPTKVVSSSFTHYTNITELKDDAESNIDVEEWKSVYDSLTEQYINKLIQMSHTFEDLLIPEAPLVESVEPISPPYVMPASLPREGYGYSPDSAFIDMLDRMGLTQSVSAESSYFQLPHNMKQDTFPIHQPAVTTEHKTYPKADQTFQELADILVSRQMPAYNLPYGLSPKPPISSTRTPSPRLNISVPSIPDIRGKFDFIRPQFEKTPDSDMTSVPSESFDVFQGLNMADYDTPSPGGPITLAHQPTSLPLSSRQAHFSSPPAKHNEPVYTETEIVSSEIKLNISSPQKRRKESNLSPQNEIETELQNMGLGWARTTLRKTREAAELSPGSSSGRTDPSPLSRPRKQMPSVNKSRDRSVRSPNSRYSSPIESESPPPNFWSTSLDSVNNAVVASSSKTKKQTITRIRKDSSDLTTPNVSSRSRTPTKKSLSRSSSPRR